MCHYHIDATGAEAKPSPYLLVAIGARLGMPVVERIPGDDLEAILKRAEQLDDNNEGFVLRWPDARALVRKPAITDPSAITHCVDDEVFPAGDYRVKVKGEPYKRLHRLLSDVTPNRLAAEWFAGTIGELLVLMPEEFREESEQAVAELDARTLVLVRDVEATFAQAPCGDQRAFAAWVKEQDSRLRGFLFGRRQQEMPGFSQRLANDTLAALIDSGRLEALLDPVGQAVLRRALASYEQEVSSYLWENTRTPESRSKLNALVPRLPKVLRGELSNAVEGLQPALMVERLRAYVKQPDQVGRLGQVDVERMFSKAPDPEAAIEHHKTWVFGQPLELRSFLDRWRACGRRETATVKARALLASAVRNNCVAELTGVLSAAVGDESQALVAALPEFANQLARVWQARPQSKDPRKLLEWTATLGALAPWAEALIREAWSAYRATMRDAYALEGKELSFTDRFEDA